MKIDQGVIDEIKASIDIVDYIGARVKLRKNGRDNFTGLCPFHKDTNDSFIVSRIKQLWNCLGACSANGNGKSGGDIISFVMKHEGCSFPDAIRKLRPDLDAKPETPRKSSQLLSHVIEAYHRSFLESRTAQEYISSRGIDPALAKQYRAGYVDGSLLEKVSCESADWKALQDIGVITKAGNELMRTCVTFPMTAFNQIPVGLYGRATTKHLHLYLTGTPRRGLFNWNVAKNHQEIILAESIIDALSFIQAGYLNVLPIYGTNGYIDEHTDFFTRFATKKVILALDPDESGRAATATIAERLAAMKIQTATLEVPAEDANALLTREGVDGFKHIVDELLKEKPASVVVPTPDPEPVLSTPLPYEELSEGEILINIEDRSYTVRGVPKKTYSRLRVALMLSTNSKTYLDGVDLILTRSRTAYATACSSHFDIPRPTIENDLTTLLNIIEQYQRRPAETAKSAAEKMSEQERMEALRLLQSPKLLDEVIADMETLGYVGEEANKKLGYLASISRFLDDPLSIVILSQSGSGKSYLAEVLEKMAAPEDVKMYSRLTPASLYYAGEYVLSHKFVIIEERAGSAEADYSIRSLQSRKMLSLFAALKDPATGKIVSTEFKIYGPTAFIETTTSSKINYENSTRCYELYLSETTEQTQKIHQMQRFMKTLAGARLRAAQQDLLAKHHNAQRLLNKVTVVIPYADAIEFPASWLRTRRDHQRFLNLIEVIAFLHQHQRPLKSDAQTGLQYIEATLADYEIARKLAEDILPDTLSDLKKPLSDFKDRIEEYVDAAAKTKKIGKHDVIFTRRTIREETGLPNHRIKELFAELEELEYLEVEKAQRGSMFRYRLVPGKVGHRVSALLSAETLRKKLVEK